MAFASERLVAPSLFAAILKWGIYCEVVLRNNVKRKSTRASATWEIPHSSIASYKEGVATAQMQMPFRAILRSWTLLPSHKLDRLQLHALPGPFISDYNIYYITYYDVWAVG